MQPASTVDLSMAGSPARSRSFLRLAILALLALSWWLAFRRDKAEQLYEITDATGFTNLNGKYYTWQFNPPYLVFYSVEIASGKRTVIGRDNLGPNSASGLSAADSGIYYSVHLPVTTGAGGGVGAGSSTSVYLGAFLHSPTRPPLPGEVRKRFRFGAPFPTPKSDWRMMPLSGGSPKTLKVDMLGEDLERTVHAFGPEGVYWIQGNAKSLISVTAPIGRLRIGQWTEYEPANCLMFSAYDGSAPKQLASHISSSSLWLTHSCVLWRTLRVYPDKTNDIHCLSVLDGQQWKLSEISGEDYRWAPAELYGRLYWTEGGQSHSRGAFRDRLVSVRCDGTDRRIELDAASSGRQVETLSGNQGDVFATLLRSGPHESVRDSENRIYTSGSPTFTRTLTRLAQRRLGRSSDELNLSKYGSSGDIYLDGDYVYFSKGEDVTSLLDWLYPSTTLKRVWHMYRVPLPR